MEQLHELYQLDDFLGETAVDGVDVLGEGAAWLRLDLLHLLESATGDEQPASLGVVRQHLTELSDHVLEYVGWRVVQERLQCGQEHALLQQVLQRLLRLSTTRPNLTPRAGSEVVRIDPLRFLAGCPTRRLNHGSVCPLS